MPAYPFSATTQHPGCHSSNSRPAPQPKNSLIYKAANVMVKPGLCFPPGIAGASTMRETISRDLSLLSRSCWDRWFRRNPRRPCPCRRTRRAGIWKGKPGPPNIRGANAFASRAGPRSSRIWRCGTGSLTWMSQRRQSAGSLESNFESRTTAPTPSGFIFARTSPGFPMRCNIRRSSTPASTGRFTMGLASPAR
jgi:hypothetical protein